MKPTTRQTVTFWTVLTLTAAADLLSKWWFFNHSRLAPYSEGDHRSWTWIPEVLFIHLARNDRGLFGLNLSVTVLAALSVVALVAILAVVTFRRLKPVYTLALALVAGGAVGNTWDRLVPPNTVRDFVLVDLQVYRWPIFNIADVAICIGMGLIIWAEIRLAWTECRQKQSDKTTRNTD